MLTGSHASALVEVLPELVPRFVTQAGNSITISSELLIGWYDSRCRQRTWAGLTGQTSTIQAQLQAASIPLAKGVRECFPQNVVRPVHIGVEAVAHPSPDTAHA